MVSSGTAMAAAAADLSPWRRVTPTSFGNAISSPWGQDEPCP
ncbi:hypothetical protein SBD_0792 [Streptomyces bottropensis ATCC 25435]|uniref:Uncharacterized protein n=1 Tax=Streptomyces bottropensis ATCC 25435 TaxID=1054862 RepID=M3FYD5_9ACTN|nr:hypothetical protein SBD_0792 [Streptomyces bottropensis ATCC 25435]